MGSVVRVVDCWNEGEEPCDDGENTIPKDVGSCYLLVTGKRVVECHFRYSKESNLNSVIFAVTVLRIRRQEIRSEKMLELGEGGEGGRGDDDEVVGLSRQSMATISPGHTLSTPAHTTLEQTPHTIRTCFRAADLFGRWRWW